MGNGIRKLNLCSDHAGDISRRHDFAVVFNGSNLDEGLGHSFCYIRPEPYRLPSSKVYSEEATVFPKTTTFSCISGASVSANTSTPLSTALVDVYMYNSFDRAAAFQSSPSFASIPLQPVPRGIFNYRASSSPSKSIGVSYSSGPIERGFLSGPIERGFLSGPIDKGVYSSTIEKVYDDQLQKSYSQGEFRSQPKSKKPGLIKNLRRAISKKLSRGRKSISAPINGQDLKNGLENSCEHIASVSSTNMSSQLSLNCDDSEDDESLESQNLQWAQGKAGEDRVHIVISEDEGWVFVGIYDGFNGPDAPDFLLSNLYSAVHKELKGLLWNEKMETEQAPSFSNVKLDQSEENQRKWQCEFDRERLDHYRNSNQESDRSCSNGGISSGINHGDVLNALSRALKKTEEAYLGIADRMVVENPELALMGSCVLAMLMKGEDVYLMNVGDSRAVLAQSSDLDTTIQPRNQETKHDLQDYRGGDESGELITLSALQLTLDHSTSVKEEIKRIKKEHPNDAFAIMNDRVKGSLKVTRAFGAGFLKQPKWNNALLKVFRIDYVGSSPYINCKPFLHHHRLGQKDKFLILSSDGLYQYFTNEEAVSQVEVFMSSSPEGDPAQHLIEEVLFRAAKKADMDFHELLEIPQGDRRKFHDDVSIIIISFEGRIWRSPV